MFNYSTGSNCLYTNADYLLNKVKELKTIAKNLHLLVIVIAEIKLKNNRFGITPSEISIQNYDLIHTDLTNPDHTGCILCPQGFRYL